MEHTLLSILKSLCGILWGPRMLVLMDLRPHRFGPDRRRVEPRAPGLLGPLAPHRVARQETRAYLGGLRQS